MIVSKWQEMFNHLLQQVCELTFGQILEEWILLHETSDSTLNSPAAITLTLHTRKPSLFSASVYSYWEIFPSLREAWYLLMWAREPSRALLCSPGEGGKPSLDTPWVTRSQRTSREQFCRLWDVPLQDYPGELQWLESIRAWENNIQLALSFWLTCLHCVRWWL